MQRYACGLCHWPAASFVMQDSAAISQAVGVMKCREIDIDYLFLLDALERGEVPTAEDRKTLIAMGLVDATAEGLRLTLEAKVKLENLRSSMREYPFGHFPV